MKNRQFRTSMNTIYHINNLNILKIKPSIMRSLISIFGEHFKSGGWNNDKKIKINLVQNCRR